LIPMVFPDYQRVDNNNVRGNFEKLGGAKLDPPPGLTVVEIMDAVHAGKLHGMYIMGENPAMSDPDVEHAREALAELDMLVVQDIFLTETGYLADVILPASAFPEKTGTFTNTDRMVQLGRKALEMPGDARQDLWIIQEMVKRLGLNWNYQGPDSGVEQVFDEMRRAMPSIAGITWERLQSEHSVTYPCENVGDPGEPVVFTEDFPTEDGRGKFVPARLIPANEQPDRDYPMVLITGRLLEHWHTGSMTRRSGVLDSLEPQPIAALNPQDMEEIGVKPGEIVTLETRRGKISLYARVAEGAPRGSVFVAFCYYEAAANLLTNPALDPFGKIPEFKYCAVRATAGGEMGPTMSFGGGQLLSAN
ncbi:MAG: molybdopterin oxidoreductase family protein, partial [Burkholderiales bacterium]